MQQKTADLYWFGEMLFLLFAIPFVDPSRKFTYYSISNGGLIKLWKISIFNR
jgi:hypothetical protein